MGEGIIGMSKSVSKVLQNSSSTGGSDIAVIISSVLLIYFIWVLYFDQIENDRFGTIRQQIWAILHYPLHVAILLTVEGSTALILWNIIINTDNRLWSLFPVYYLSDYESYKSPEGLVQYLTEAVQDLATKFKPGQLEEGYNWEGNFTSILNITAPFGKEEWNEKADEIVYEMWTGIENFIFENFGVKVETKQHGVSAGASGGGSETQKNEALWNVYMTVFTYFYIAGGMLLVILGVMYWFGKTNKTRGEWASIAIRVIAGAGMTMTTLAFYHPINLMSLFSFYSSAWLIPIVMLGYFVVIVADNLLVWHSNQTIARMTSNEGHQSKRDTLESESDHRSETGSAMGERRGDHNV